MSRETGKDSELLTCQACMNGWWNEGFNKGRNITKSHTFEKVVDSRDRVKRCGTQKKSEFQTEN